VERVKHLVLLVTKIDAGVDVDANGYVGADDDEALDAKTARWIVASLDFQVEFAMVTGRLKS
jgi:hypothetical protein